MKSLWVFAALLLSALWSTPVFAQEEPVDPAASTNTIYLPVIAASNEAVADDAGVFQEFVPNPDALTLEPTGEVGAAGVCVRVPWGPGKVIWSMSNPKSYGYSVKPETSSSLVWAAAPSQDVDGIYRSSWGSCKALKIPDSCTTTVNSSGSISSCCNAAMAVAGHVVKWVDTCSSSSPESGWPDKPLQ